MLKTANLVYIRENTQYFITPKIIAFNVQTWTKPIHLT